jgi:four helix bundle protein
MSRGGFESLLVWQKGQALAVSIYKVIRADGFARESALVDQMRRAAVSVSSNIAEGDERDTDKDSVRFFYIAKVSIAALRSQLDLCRQISLLTEKEFADLDLLCEEDAKMLRGLIKARSPHA